MAKDFSKRPTPIFTASYALLLDIHTATEKMPRALKHGLGEELSRTGVQLVARITSALSGNPDKQVLREASWRLDELRVLVRLAKDMRGFSIGQYEKFSLQTDDVGRQLGAWMRRRREQTPITEPTA